jgi:hypothetical protein
MKRSSPPPPPPAPTKTNAVQRAPFENEENIRDNSADLRWDNWKIRGRRRRVIVEVLHCELSTNFYRKNSWNE